MNTKGRKQKSCVIYPPYLTIRISKDEVSKYLKDEHKKQTQNDKKDLAVHDVGAKALNRVSHTRKETERL